MGGSGAGGWVGRERRSDGDGRRNDDRDLAALRTEFDAFRARVQPLLLLYELLVPYGLDRLMQPLLEWFANQLRDTELDTRKRSFWDLRWARWAAVLAVIWAAAQVTLLALTVWNTVRHP
jgi:hypothetical protein